ncbi:MAG: hypothetical protein R3F03_10580 [Opitutaceae bacterium]
MTDDWQLIDECKQGHMTFRLTIKFEPIEGHPHFRLRVAAHKGDGRTGTRTRGFSWPMADLGNPSELRDFTELILAAAEPGAPRHDDRGVIGRCFDRLFGIELINVVPLAELSGPPAKTLTARITRDRTGTQATLHYQQKGHSPLWLIIPLESIARLREQLHA